MYSPLIANLFCELYDGVDVEALMPAIAPARADRRVRARRDAVAHAICAGDYDCDRARKECRGDADGWITLGHLLGIDRALARANIFHAAAPPPALSDLVSHYEQHGCFTTDAVEGALLPRACEPGRPEQEPARFCDNFPGLTRVSKETWEAADHAVFPLSARISLDDLTDGLEVGCVPLVEDHRELEWRSYERDDVRYYHLPLDEAGISARISEVLDALESARVQVAVFPELTASDELIARWRSNILARSGRGWALRWIFLGSGDCSRNGSRPVNAGVLLDASSGETLLAQRKMHGFTLTPTQIKGWGLPLPDEHALDEDIEKARRCCIAETGSGRIAIFICQDLSESSEFDDLVNEHAISHLLTPVFSEPTAPHYWEHQAAKTWARDAGTTTIVANSLVVGRLQGKTDAVHAALVHAPFGNRACTAAGPCDVQTARIIAGDGVY